MKKYLVFALMLFAAPVAAQDIQNPCPFGTTAGTCIQGAGAGGTPSSVTLTNGTGLPLTTGVTGILPIANGGTGISSHPSWSIYRNTSVQTGIVSATYTTTAFNAASFDAASLCDLSVNVGRCTVTIAGKYQVNAAVAVTGTLTATAQNYCAFYVNGARVKEVATNGATVANVPLACSALLNLAASDYVEVKIYVTTSASTASVSNGISDTWFDGSWTGP